MAKYADYVSAGVFTLFAVVCLIISVQMPLGTLSEPKPGMLPVIISIFILGVSLLRILQVARNINCGVEAVGDNWRQPATVISGLLLYSLSLEQLGYLIATAALSFAVMLTFEPRAWLKSLIIGIVASVASYILFNRLLDVQLPPGLLNGII